MPKDLECSQKPAQCVANKDKHKTCRTTPLNHVNIYKSRNIQRKTLKCYTFLLIQPLSKVDKFFADNRNPNGTNSVTPLGDLFILLFKADCVY